MIGLAIYKLLFTINLTLIFSLKKILFTKEPLALSVNISSDSLRLVKFNVIFCLLLVGFDIIIS